MNRSVEPLGSQTTQPPRIEKRPEPRASGTAEAALRRMARYGRTVAEETIGGVVGFVLLSSATEAPPSPGGTAGLAEGPVEDAVASLELFAGGSLLWGFVQETASPAQKNKPLTLRHDMARKRF